MNAIMNGTIADLSNALALINIAVHYVTGNLPMKTVAIKIVIWGGVNIPRVIQTCKVLIE